MLLHKINYSGTSSSSSEVDGQGGNTRNLFDFITTQQQGKSLSFLVPSVSVPMPLGGAKTLRHTLSSYLVFSHYSLLFIADGENVRTSSTILKSSSATHTAAAWSTWLKCQQRDRCFRSRQSHLTIFHTKKRYMTSRRRSVTGPSVSNIIGKHPKLVAGGFCICVAREMSSSIKLILYVFKKIKKKRFSCDDEIDQKGS